MVSDRSDRARAPIPETRRRRSPAISGSSGFTALAVLAGFYVAIPVYVVAYLRLYARRPLAISLLIALVLTTALYVLFAILLGYDIFEGLVFGGYM